MEVPRSKKFNSWSGCFGDDRSLYSYDEPYNSDYSEHVIVSTCLRTTSTSNTEIEIILDIKDRTPHLRMQPYTDKEWKKYEHRVVYLISGEPFHINDLLDMVMTHVAERDPSGQNSTAPPGELL